ncbi:hypothetical protein [Bradyrhizobium jicamae]|uniref:hypothetical protein n=1 Tax=Bradyrhizobium jicamae TaxID=280332 RepID=UPI0012EE68B3|nr:hypothetical protein [Bradyrhizobium jicamae]
MDDRLGTKAAHGENQKQNLHLRSEGFKPGDGDAALMVPPAKGQRGHHHRDDAALCHRERPFWAAIRINWRN